MVCKLFNISVHLLVGFIIYTIAIPKMLIMTIVTSFDIYDFQLLSE